jgi:methanogenic corrinoid protein MtbC1
MRYWRGMMGDEILTNLAKAVKEYDNAGAESWARRAMEEGIEPMAALDALTDAIREVGDGFAAGELFIPELVSAAQAMQSAMPVIEGVITQRGGTRTSAGKVVAGSVHGDIHSIGKTNLCTLLTASGFEVIDLGVDVPLERFVETVREEEADVLAMSALLTVTAQEMGRVIEALGAEGIRERVKVIVGGAAVSDRFADKIGADGYDPTAPGGVRLAQELLRA